LAYQLSFKNFRFFGLLAAADLKRTQFATHRKMGAQAEKQAHSIHYRPGTQSCRTQQNRNPYFLLIISILFQLSIVNYQFPLFTEPAFGTFSRSTGYNCRTSYSPSPFCAFSAHKMAATRASALEPAAGGDFDPLGQALMSLLLRHLIIPSKEP